MAVKAIESRPIRVLAATMKIVPKPIQRGFGGLADLLGWCLNLQMHHPHYLTADRYDTGGYRQRAREWNKFTEYRPVFFFVPVEMKDRFEDFPLVQSLISRTRVTHDRILRQMLPGQKVKESHRYRFETLVPNEIVYRAMLDDCSFAQRGLKNPLVILLSAGLLWLPLLLSISVISRRKKSAQAALDTIAKDKEMIQEIKAHFGLEGRENVFGLPSYLS